MITIEKDSLDSHPCLNRSGSLLFRNPKIPSWQLSPLPGLSSHLRFLVASQFQREYLDKRDLLQAVRGGFSKGKWAAEGLEHGQRKSFWQCMKERHLFVLMGSCRLCRSCLCLYTVDVLYLWPENFKADGSPGFPEYSPLVISQSVLNSDKLQ